MRPRSAEPRRWRPAPCCAALILGACIGAVHAGQPAALEVPVEALRDQVLEIHARALDVEDALRGPALSFYAAVSGGGPALKSIELSIDGRPPLLRSLDPREAAALAQGGASLLLQERFEPGAHRVHAVFTVATAAGGEAGIEYHGELETAAPVAELVLEQPGLLSGAGIALLTLRPVQRKAPGILSFHAIGEWLSGGKSGDREYVAGGADDPLLMQARTLAAMGRHLDAAALLLQQRGGLPGAAQPVSDLELIGNLLRYGDIGRAAQLYRSARGRQPQSEALLDLGLELADAYYRKGRFDEAEGALGEDPRTRDKRRENDWRDLRALVLLARQRYDEAATVLRDADKGADLQSYVGYYNLGVALILEGFSDQGATVLDRVGTIVSNDRDLQALSDRANLVLGSQFLQIGQGATAIPILERIRSEGPYSNKALLNLGWSWLAPAGTAQKRTELGDERTVGPPPEARIAGLTSINDKNLYQRYHLNPFARASLDPDKEQRLRNALVIWSQLVGRDPSDPAVQEGMLAAAMVLDRLGAGQQAVAFYQKGADALERSDRELEHANEYVAGASWIKELLQRDAADGGDYGWQLRDLPQVAVSSHILGLLAGDPFQDLMKEYRDLRLMLADLAVLDAHLQPLEGLPAAVLDNDPDSAGALRARIAGLRDRIHAAQDAQEAKLRGMVVEQLDVERRRNDKLLYETRLQLARDYDRAGAPNSEQ